MSLGPDAGSLTRGRFTYFPVVPGRLEFSAALRRHMLETKPGIIAVELPGGLEDTYHRAVARLPEMSVILFSDPQDDDRGVYIPVEPADPFTEAIRTANEFGSQVIFMEPDSADRPHLPDSYPDSYAVKRAGLPAYIEAYRVYPQPRSDEVTDHASAMAWKLQGADPMANVLVVVSLNLLDPLLDAMEVPQDAPRRRRFDEVRLLNPHPDCLAEITVEYPYLQDRYEFYRIELRHEESVDKPRTQYELLKEAEAKYVVNTGDKLQYWHRRLIAKYSRNLAHISGDLCCRAFDLAVAARSIVDDNYGYEVWHMANRYPAQQAACDLETVNLSGDEIWVNTRKVKIRRRLPRPKQRLRPAGLKERKREKHAGEWAEQTTGNSICSYPPEDLVIENYGRFIKKKAKSILSEERVRVEPFTTSVLDGIDMRETIRHWHERKIFVRQLDRLSGEVGAVVVIFDEDRDGRYYYQTTWLGEHQNESDMAFYATHPFDHIVGPGIGRAEYGGFLMVLPPRRMIDVWGDADYDYAESKSERLLMAALDYSVERYVVYVGAKPPRSIFRSIAAHLNRKIIYVPIGQLSPVKLQKIRVVHVLDSHARREKAKDYLW